jgi:hypothetical protein
MIVITATLLVIGGVGTIQNDKAAIRATVALMTIWGFLVCFSKSFQTRNDLVFVKFFIEFFVTNAKL